MADLRGGVRDARPPPPWASKFFQFHAVFGRIWQNCVFTPLLEGSRPHLGEILDPSLPPLGIVERMQRKQSMNFFHEELIIILIESHIMRGCDEQLRVRCLDLTSLRRYKIMLSYSSHFNYIWGSPWNTNYLTNLVGVYSCVHSIIQTLKSKKKTYWPKKDIENIGEVFGLVGGLLNLKF